MPGLRLLPAVHRHRSMKQKQKRRWTLAEGLVNYPIPHLENDLSLVLWGV